MKSLAPTRLLLVCLLWTGLCVCDSNGLLAQANAQPQLSEQKSGPVPDYGIARMQEFMQKRNGLAGGGRVDKPVWAADGKSLSFGLNDKRWALDLGSGQVAESAAEPAAAERPKGLPSRPAGTPVRRAEQRTVEPSPDGKWKAVYRDANVWLESTAEPIEKRQLTTTGSEFHRFGTCCWVYGEELNQKDAMWWSPDSGKLAWYEVDEAGMKDYHLTLANEDLYTALKTVRYPKPGEKNPEVSLWIYDLAKQEAKKVSIPGEPMQYLYNVRYTPSGKELLVNRTGRRQNVLDVLAIDIETLAVRTVLTETQETWQENSPGMQFLSDGERFIWETEANGYRHFQLRHLDGRLLNPLSQVANYPCNRIELVDEAAGYFYYSAFSDANPYSTQLHRVRLDGSDHRRLTSSPLNHTSFDISPSNRFVLAVREQYDIPPCTVVYDEDGKEVAELAKGSVEAAAAAGFAPPEMFSFTTDDGKTMIYGVLNKPSQFDPARKYPLVIDVYGGPESQAFNNRYTPMNPACELGFVIAKIGNRGTVGRGKAFESATYLKLGGPDIADQAEGVRFLCQRAYIDSSRVGIFGHSYGGYMSALAVLKYPDVFQVSVSGAPVTDWRNYDSIYTERYMRTPQENPEGYTAGACMQFASQLKGKLFLVHGLVDDNVHPANTWQLGKALHAANKRFDQMIYPEFDHGIGSTYGMLRWEYLLEHLK
jgi:dipeptidyl-peptidase-4